MRSQRRMGADETTAAYSHVFVNDNVGLDHNRLANLHVGAETHSGIYAAVFTGLGSCGCENYTFSPATAEESNPGERAGRPGIADPEPHEHKAGPAPEFSSLP